MSGFSPDERRSAWWSVGGSRYPCYMVGKEATQPMKSIRNHNLSLSVLRDHLTYDPATGFFCWTGKNPRYAANSRAGHLHKFGYRWIHISGKKIAAHRLAWLYEHGKWPDCQIDHQNGDKDDNRISNLRDVNASMNALNIHRPNGKTKTGVRGITLERGKYRAEVSTRPKRHFLGRFNTLEEAKQAYDNCKRKLMGEHHG